ncbi:MAG: hypothetical protein KAS18_11375 [Calditrichia bacterium]|nr:hypothetical protein [Calditrichia bacterium]
MDFKLNKKYLVYSLIIIGAIGLVIFFPVNFNNEYTCLYHRIFYADKHISMKLHHQNSQGYDIEHSFEYYGKAEMNTLLKYYIGHYAAFWWTSIVIFSISIVLIKKIFDGKLKKIT